MSWKEDYVSLNYLSQEVTQFVNEHGDEVELETIQFHDHYKVWATICTEGPSSKDYFSEGRDFHSPEKATNLALEELYRQAYYLS